MSIVPGIQLHTQNFDPFYRQILLGGAPDPLDPINNFNAMLLSVPDFRRYENIGINLQGYFSTYQHVIVRKGNMHIKEHDAPSPIFSVNEAGFNLFCSRLMIPLQARMVWKELGMSVNTEMRKIINSESIFISTGNDLRPTAENCMSGHCPTDNQCVNVIGLPIIQDDSTSAVSATGDKISALITEIRATSKTPSILATTIPSTITNFKDIKTEDDAYTGDTVTRCSICGIINRRATNNIKFLNCQFSCEHTLEVLLLLMTLGLSPFQYDPGVHSADIALYQAAINFLKMTSCYTYCCQRCNMLKSSCQTAKLDYCTIFVDFDGTQFVNNELIYEFFCEKFFTNEKYYYCDDYIKYHIISILIYYGPNTVPDVNQYINYYFGNNNLLKDNVLACAKIDSRGYGSAYDYIKSKIKATVNPLVHWLNITLNNIWGRRFSDMMIFGLLKMIVIQIVDIKVVGGLTHITKGPVQSKVKRFGGTKNISKINNSLLNYNLKGGVQSSEELAVLINYGTLNCIDRPLSFKGSVYTVIAAQKFKQLLRQKGIEITPQQEAEVKNVAIEVIEATNTHRQTAHEIIDKLQLNTNEKEVVYSIVQEYDATQEEAPDEKEVVYSIVQEYDATQEEAPAEERRKKEFMQQRTAKRAEEKKKESKTIGKFDRYKVEREQRKNESGMGSIGGTLHKRKTRKNKRKTKRRKHKKHLKRKTRK
jgi:hypothetical protein